MNTNDKKTLAQLESEIAAAEQQKRYEEHRLHILDRQAAALNRKQRTRRLCVRGGMLEKFLIKPEYMTDDDVHSFLDHIFSLTEVNNALEQLLWKVHEDTERQDGAP